LSGRDSTTDGREREIAGKGRFSDFFPLFERERLLFGALSGKLVASDKGETGFDGVRRVGEGGLSSGSKVG
jgi:hypothetical protein